MGTAFSGSPIAIATQTQRGVTSGADMMGFLFDSGNPAQNHLMNGACEIWQRGTSFSNGAGGSSYTADRWYCGSSGTTSTFVRSTDVPSGFYGYSIEGTDGGNSYSYFSQRIEAANARALVGKTVTAHFWIKTANPESAYILLGYAASEDVFSSITQISLVNVSSQVTANQWSLVKVNFTVPAQGANGLAVTVYFNYASGGARTAKFTGAMLNVGSVAQPFARAGGSIAGELALCQRYYIRLQGTGNHRIAQGIADTTARVRMSITLGTQMRATPTPIISNLEIVPGAIALTSLTALGTQAISAIANVSGTPLVASTTYQLSDSSGIGYLAFDAEMMG